MKRAITVGMGFGKHSLEDAITSSQTGDVIVVEPGTYSFPNGFTAMQLKIRGLGNRPSEVVLKTSFSVKQKGSMELANLSLVNEDKDTNAIYVDNGQLILKNVTVQNNSAEYPAVFLHQSTYQAQNTEINNINSDSYCGVAAETNSRLVISESDVYAINLTRSKLTINTSQIRFGINADENSEVLSNALYLADTRNDFFALVIQKGSTMDIDQLFVPDGLINVNVVSGSLNVKQSNVDLGHQVIITKDEASIVDVPGATVNEHIDGSKPVSSETQEPGEADTDPTQAAKSSEKQEEMQNDNENLNPISDGTRAIDELDSMVGLESVKKDIHKFIEMAIFNKRRISQGLEPISQSYHSLFLGNPGTGKTTVARLVAKAMYQEGVMPTDSYLEVSRQDLVSQNVGGTALQTQHVLEKATGGVLFIDEAYTLYQDGGAVNWGQEAVDTILKYMEDHRADLMIIFAGYTKEMKDFIAMNPGLSSRAPNIFTFEDYTTKQIVQIGEMILRAQQFQFDESYYSKAVAEIYESDVDHSNGRWIRNFNEKLIRIVATNAMKDEAHGVSEIFNSDMNELTGGNEQERHDETQKLLTQLDDMIGLNNVKKFVHELVKKIQVEKQLKDKIPDEEKPTYHMVFSGNPGTGKTTVARIVAKLFYNLGILPKDTVMEVSRTDLVAGYIGQSEERTAKAVRDAMGGVLFVDEAYQLTAQGGANDFGKQVVETLITELENNRSKFVAIFAGYTEPMKEFLTVNPGLQSRIPLTIEFEDYTPQEVAQIVARRLSKKWIVNDSLLVPLVAQKYSRTPKNEQSNGRWARTLTDKIVEQQKLWLSDNSDAKNPRVIGDDIIIRLTTQ